MMSANCCWTGAVRVRHAGSMLRTVHGAAVEPDPTEAGRPTAQGTSLTQRRVVDFGLVNSARCR